MLDPVDFKVPDGNTVQVRPLPGAAWRKCKRVRALETRDDAASMFSMLPEGIVEKMMSPDKSERDEAVRSLQELEYNIDNVDIPTVLRYGLVRTPYSIPGIDADAEAPDDFDADTHDPSEYLDNPTTVAITEEILRLTKPPTEDEEGNS